MKNETAMTRTLAQLGREGLLFRIFKAGTGVETLQMAFDDLLGTLAEIGEDSGDLYSDLSNFWVWLWETAPFFNPFNAQAWVEYWLALKGSMLLDVRLQLPRGLITVGSSLAGSVFEDLTGHGLEGEPVLQIEFLKDGRTIDQRRGNALALQVNGQPALDPIEYINAKLDDQREILGFNNIAAITFGKSQGSTEVDQIRHELLWHTHDNRAAAEAPLFVTRHGERRVAEGLHAEMARIAQEQYAWWHPATGPIVESDDRGREILAEYWTSMGAHHDRALKNEPAFTVVVHGDSVRKVGFWYYYGGNGTVLHWSATFISWVVHHAGGGDRLFYSPRHIDYLRAAKGADKATRFALLDRSDPEATPRVGDIVAARSSKTPSPQD